MGKKVEKGHSEGGKKLETIFTSEGEWTYSDWEPQPTYGFLSLLIRPIINPKNVFLQILILALPNFMWQYTARYICTFRSLTAMFIYCRIWETKFSWQIEGKKFSLSLSHSHIHTRIFFISWKEITMAELTGSMNAHFAHFECIIYLSPGIINLF